MPRRGVRYYRCVPPPEGEWEQDYATIARWGFELVVVPVPWALAQGVEGRLDFSPLLRQAAIAGRHGLGVVVAPDAGSDEAAGEVVAFVRAVAVAAAPHASVAAYDLSAFHGARLAECLRAVAEADPRRPIISSELSPADAATGLSVAAGGLLPHQAVDRWRAAASGRPLWVLGLPADSSMRARLQAWSSLIAGAYAVVYEAWRPELSATAGPALARPDGAPSERLRAVAALDVLLARHPALRGARAGAAEAAVVVVSESAEFWASGGRDERLYADALAGAYAALGSRGAHVEFAPPAALAGYPVAYAPLATAVSRETAEALRRYVEGGGCLVAEAGLATCDERAVSARESPRHGLGEVFGTRALDVPEAVGDEPRPTFTGRRGPYPCYRCRQPLEAVGGSVKSVFADGAAAIVDNALGLGSARLIGTQPSLGCARTEDKRYAQVILDSLAYAKVRQRVVTTASQVCARLLEGEGGERFLVAFNQAAAPQEARLRVSGALGRFRRALDLVSGRYLRLLNNGLRVKMPPADGVVLQLDTVPRRRRWRPGRGVT